jgi:hypothetical protein
MSKTNEWRKFAKQKPHLTNRRLKKIYLQKALAEVLRIKVVEPAPSMSFNPLVSSKQNDPTKVVRHYYVHYIDYNKRLDEWVTIDRMNVEKLQAPNSSSSSSSGHGAAAVAAKAANSISASSSMAHLSSVTNSPMHQSASKKELANLANKGSGGGAVVDQNGDLDSSSSANRQRKKRKLSPQPTIGRSQSQISVQSPAIPHTPSSGKDDKTGIIDLLKDETSEPKSER